MPTRTLDRRSSPATLLALRLVLALLIAGCSTAAPADDPPELNLGRDICERCGMIIEDVRFASGYRLGDGTSRIFDDIGGMLAWAELSGEFDEARMWVHDYDSETWIDATTATFVFSSDLMTPMAFGIAAFSTKEAAAAFAEGMDATVHSWEDVSTVGEAREIEDHRGNGAEGSNEDRTAHGVGSVTQNEQIGS